MACHLRASVCPLNRETGFWCLREDFTHALWVLNNKKQASQGYGFLVRQVLDAVLRFLQHPSSYVLTSGPFWPEVEKLSVADFAVSFNERNDNGDPLLPPRMAYKLMCAAGWVADTLADILDDCGMDFPQRLFVTLPSVAQQYLRGSASWRLLFRQCYIRLYVRLRKGLSPAPNCIGEELALHTLFQYVETDEHPDSKFDSDDKYWTLPRFPNDEYPKAYGIEDYDVLSNIGQQTFRLANMHPESWFEAFRPESFWADVVRSS